MNYIDSKVEEIKLAKYLTKLWPTQQKRFTK